MPDVFLLVWFIVIAEALCRLVQVAAATACVVVAFRISLRFRWFYRIVFWVLLMAEHFVERLVAWMIAHRPK